MSDMTWDELRSEFWRLCGEDAYAEALALITPRAHIFPDRGRFHNWRMCMAARVGDTALALQAFEQALADDFWCAPKMLREDEDLASLQGLPEFERLAAICQERFEAARARAQPALTVIQPEGRTGPYPALLALHGNFGTSAASIDFWHTAVAQGWLLALPQSSQIIWPNAYVWNDRDRAVPEIQAHYATLAEQYPIDRSRVVVGGFSMGGGLAIWLTVSGAIEARGFVAVSPFLKDIQSLAPLLDARDPRTLRGYIIVGEQDEGCIKISRQLADLMASRDLACKIELHPGLGHEFPPDFAPSLANGLRFVLGEE
ncbi:MAG: alpha/beta hydrolase [Roseiflexaceae bacterium]